MLGPSLRMKKKMRVPPGVFDKVQLNYREELEHLLKVCM